MTKMKKLIMNWRCWLLAIVCIAAGLALVAMPSESHPMFWGLLIGSKVLAFALACLASALFPILGRNGGLKDLIEWVGKD